MVGAEAPADLLACRDERVRILGHVPDVGPWFDSLRLTVAPLRFGAGAKGKVATSLAAGVPCVVSSVASEGMSLTGEPGIAVADAPDAFAQAVVAIYTDADRWERLSRSGRDYVAQKLSPAAWQERLDATLRRIGL